MSQNRALNASRRLEDCPALIWWEFILADLEQIRQNFFLPKFLSLKYLMLKKQNYQYDQ